MRKKFKIKQGNNTYLNKIMQKYSLNCKSVIYNLSSSVYNSNNI